MPPSFRHLSTRPEAGQPKENDCKHWNPMPPIDPKPTALSTCANHASRISDGVNRGHREQPA